MNHNMGSFDDFFNHLGISATKGFYTPTQSGGSYGVNHGPAPNNQRPQSSPPINQKVFWKSLVLTLQKCLDVVILGSSVAAHEKRNKTRCA